MMMMMMMMMMMTMMMMTMMMIKCCSLDNSEIQRCLSLCTILLKLFTK
jgi:hypothetical protein